MAKQEITVCIDANPGNDSAVFRVEAADDIFRLLVDAHETEFTIPELVDTTGAARSTVWRAIDLLDDIGAVRVRETPQRNYVAIDSRRLQKDDPVLAVEQPEFHEPIRAFVERVRDSIGDVDDVDDVIGITVFGSVARGDADRTSDVDVFLVVQGDRTTARRRVATVAADIRERRYDGDRFEFEPYVESVESARRAEDKLRDVFQEGIVVHGTDTLTDVRKAVMAGE